MSQLYYPPNDRSHFEPQLDNAWPDLDKLEWLSAGMLEDFGLPANVNEYRPGEFTVTIQGARAGLGGMPFAQAWRTLYDLAHGYAAGVRAGRGEPEICAVCNGWYAGRHSHPDIPPVVNPVVAALRARIVSGASVERDFPADFVPQEDSTPELTDAASRSVAEWADEE